ncbi:NAD(P)-dependent oxidoreductase, partial [Candidatus Gottesmanbacteria bacterium]|nr:NAD(P)-dependent oxidoreductase [Candidatus Gottesmanbacteria bacterium]
IDSPARVILHLAAKTDVDGCEKDKLLGKNGDAWRINVEGTKNIVEGAKKSGKNIIYISTDFVFDGTKEFYNENDEPNPINWYGATKYEGEKVVKDSGIPYLICRLAFPYRANFEKKKDFVRGILARLKNGEKIAMVTDEIITPTFIDDIAYALDVLIKNDARGTYHLVGSSSHTPFEIAHLIAKIFGLDESLISSTTKETYFANRAPRPFSLVLKNDKLKKLGIKMSTFEEGLKKAKSQLL